jgi:hypothetical protein
MKIVETDLSARIKRVCAAAGIVTLDHLRREYDSGRMGMYRNLGAFSLGEIKRFLKDNPDIEIRSFEVFTLEYSVIVHARGIVQATQLAIHEHKALGFDDIIAVIDVKRGLSFYKGGKDE